MTWERAEKMEYARAAYAEQPTSQANKKGGSSRANSQRRLRATIRFVDGLDMTHVLVKKLKLF